MTVGMSLCSARRCHCFPGATRRATPTAQNVGTVNDFGGWCHTPPVAVFRDHALRKTAEPTSGDRYPAPWGTICEHAARLRRGDNGPAIAIRLFLCRISLEIRTRRNVRVLGDALPILGDGREYDPVHPAHVHLHLEQ